MIEHELLSEHGVLVLRPKARLEEDDFANLADIIDPYIAQHGALRGLLLEAERFPGWQGVEGLMSHIRFVRDHHRSIERVAVITDNPVLSVLPKLANKVIHAQVRHFASDQKEAALAWLISTSDEA